MSEMVACWPTIACPSDTSLGATQYTDFRTGASSNWEAADGTTVSYDKDLGIEFTISKVTDAPTLSTKDYMFFGRVSAYVQSSPGTGTVSSFILESDDLDEIDWEYLFSKSTCHLVKGRSIDIVGSGI